MEMGRHPRAGRRARRRERLYTRTGDDIGAAFPEIVSALLDDGVIDGELLVLRDGEVAPFNDLQQRLNRKTADAEACCRSIPPGSGSTTCCEEGGEDLRALPFAQRRARLEAWYARGAAAASRPLAAACRSPAGTSCASCATARASAASKG